MARFTFVVACTCLVQFSIRVPLIAADADKTIATVDADVLQKKLMAALGDSFEFVKGESGRAKLNNSALGTRDEPIWFAHVRAKKEGDFALLITVTLDYPKDKTGLRTAERAVYTIPMRIGGKGGPRVLKPGGWGGAAWPHANVGDTVIIPVHVNEHLKDHAFAQVNNEDLWVKSYFGVMGEKMHESLLQRGGEKPAVKLDISNAGDAVKALTMVASWREARAGRSLNGPSSISYSAYFQCREPGKLNVIGSISGQAKEGDLPAGGDRVSLRIVKTDESVTALLDYMNYTQITGQNRSSGSAVLPPGTLEARVGDWLVIHCGRYRRQQTDEEPLREGVVSLEPFGAVQHHEKARAGEKEGTKD